MDTKYLEFIITQSGKTSKWLVTNKAKDERLGYITFYPQWRKYVYESFENRVYDNNCLSELVKFLNNENNKRRAAQQQKQQNKI